MPAIMPPIMATEMRAMAITETVNRTTVTKETRVGFRTTEERKAYYKRAAELRGQHLTAFAEQVLDEAAERAIAEVERIQMTARDSEFLMALLTDPLPEPPPAFVKAAEDFKASQATDD